jgi:hypothetical protein
MYDLVASVVSARLGVYGWVFLCHILVWWVLSVFIFGVWMFLMWLLPYREERFDGEYLHEVSLY